MTHSPSTAEYIARMCADLRMGLGVIVQIDQDFWLVHNVETITQARFDVMTHSASPQLVITSRRANAIGLAADDKAAQARCIPLPDRADLDWVRTLSYGADKPHIMPENLGDASFACPNDLQTASIALCKKAQLIPAVLITQLAPDAIGDLHTINLAPMMPILLAGAQSPLIKISQSSLPLDAHVDARLHLFRTSDGMAEHYAIQIGQISDDPPCLVRLHSSCFTGEVIGSLKCDCGPQLNGALHMMAERGSGVVLYMNQEGRGIGLANKIRAYHAQSIGFDTVDANHHLGFEEDERNFQYGADMLHQLGIKTVDLLTNNPAKVAQLKQAGITINQRIGLRLGENKYNSEYLATKAAKSGHIL